MGNGTTIEWADISWNPWIGCQKKDEGCDRCYAESMDTRFRRGLHWGPMAPRLMMSPTHWMQPATWNRRAERDNTRPRLFCGSSCDVFEQHTDPGVAVALDHARARLWDVIEETPRLVWMLLTKRPENFHRMLPVSWMAGDFPGNVWLGASASNQRRADERIPFLADMKNASAPITFLSYEPALGLLSIGRHLRAGSVDWVIAGCEQVDGRPGRSADIGWFRSVRDQCERGGVPFFLKQRAADGKIDKMPILDGIRHDAIPGGQIA